MGNNYRSIFKWGDPSHEEKLNKDLINYLKEKFKLSPSDLNEKYSPGIEEIKLKKISKLPPSIIKSFKRIVGDDNVIIDDYDRAYHSYGKFYLDLLKLRLGKIDSPPDAVIYPREENDIIKILKICNNKDIPITPFGGHSSVTRGVETPKGGISLDLTRYFNKIITINEINSTVTVQSGIYGPDLENYLNNYGDGYTCGHFPQSFEFSTVGGWVATRSAGQLSSGYGKIEDIVLSLKMISPIGIIESIDYPASALGPDIDQMIIGSEGCFGIITEVTLKIRRYLPKNRKLLSFIFKDYSNAITTLRKVSQGQFGSPYLFRLSDPEETDVSFRFKGKDKTLTDKILQILGYKPLKRCLMFASVEGDYDYTRLVSWKIKHIAKKAGGQYIGAYPTKQWLLQRYSSSYLRDPLMDLGIMTDTLETSCTWENILPLWFGVRNYIKERPNTICMTHISHCYENGANLYFIFLSPIKKEDPINDFSNFHAGIIDTIKKNHGSLSHHHGIGKLLAPWMSMEIGVKGIGLLQSIKDYIDPKGVMNPGKTLGLKG